MATRDTRTTARYERRDAAARKAAAYSPLRPDLGRVAIRKTKADVVGLLGKPSQVFAADGVEVLGYEYDRWGDGPYGGAWAFVRLKEGRVVGYGEDDNVAYSGNPAAATAARGSNRRRPCCGRTRSTDH